MPFFPDLLKTCHAHASPEPMPLARSAANSSSSPRRAAGSCGKARGRWKDHQKRGDCSRKTMENLDLSNLWWFISRKSGISNDTKQMQMWITSWNTVLDQHNLGFHHRKVGLKKSKRQLQIRTLWPYALTYFNIPLKHTTACPAMNMKGLLSPLCQVGLLLGSLDETNSYMLP